MPAASPSSDPQPSSSGTQPNPPIPPTVTVEEDKDDNNQDSPVHGDEDNNNQDNNPPPPPPPNTTTEAPDSSTQTQQLPDEVAVLARVLGRAIQQFVDKQDVTLNESAEQQLETLLQHGDGDEPLSMFYQELVKQEVKKLGRLAVITSGFWRLWQRDAKLSQLPLKEAISKYCKLLEGQRRDYPNTEAFYPLCLDAYSRQGSDGLRSQFHRTAEFANQKWRTPGTLIPKVYPTEYNFKSALIMPILLGGAKEMELLLFPIICNTIYGIDDEGVLVCKYFFIPEVIKETQEYLRKKREIIPKPLFPLPQTGISARMEREGMTQYEAAQASALFKIKLEACLLEIWSYTSPRLSAHTFHTQPYSIYQMIMPFWKEEVQLNPDTIQGDTSILEDLPPHIKGKGRVSFQAANTTITPENQDAWTYQSQTAQQNVGNRTSSHKPTPHFGSGRIKESTIGPQCFFNTDRTLPQRHESSSYRNPQEQEYASFQEESRFVETLPGSQDSQIDDDEANQYQPFRDPGDPDDPDDDDQGPPGRGPPGGGGRPPGRGPPGGSPPGGGRGGPFGQAPDPNDPNPGNPGANQWMPRRPQRPVPPQNQAQGNNQTGFRFDKRIKLSEIPTWDGNGDTLLEWLNTLNHISSRSLEIFQDLGQVTPLRLTEAAQRWFNALPQRRQFDIQLNWGEFKLALSTFFMTDQWYAHMKSMILRARYRQKGHESEMPINYFHQKL